MADNPQLFDPMRENNFEFVVTGIDNLLRASYLGTEQNAYISGAERVLRLAVNKASIPMFTQEPISIRSGNSVVNFAGVPTFRDGSLSVIDWVGADTKSILMAWQALSYNVSTQRVGNASDYKKLCYLIEYAPNGEAIRTWTLKGCFISGLQEGDFSDESGGKMEISATFKYDYAFMTMAEDM